MLTWSSCTGPLRPAPEDPAVDWSGHEAAEQHQGGDGAREPPAVAVVLEQ
jgi:hypothetical protein